MANVLTKKYHEILLNLSVSYVFLKFDRFSKM